MTQEDGDSSMNPVICMVWNVGKNSSLSTSEYVMTENIACHEEDSSMKQKRTGKRRNWHNPNPTVDIAITDGRRVVLIQRANEPFKGQWVFPGGFVEYNERVEDAAIREAKEETSLDVKLVDILGVYSDPHRDPRAHNISVVFVARWLEGEVMGGDDAAAAEWRDLKDLMPDDLAFDHGLVLQDLKSWLKDSSMTFWSAKER